MNGKFINGAWIQEKPVRVKSVAEQLYETELKIYGVDRRLSLIEEILKSTSMCDADLQFGRFPTSRVIVSGTINGEGYVRIFEVPPGDLQEIVKILTDFERFAGRGNIDGPNLAYRIGW